METAIEPKTFRSPLLFKGLSGTPILMKANKMQDTDTKKNKKKIISNYQ